MTKLRKELDQATIDRARQLAGLKGYAEAAIMPRLVGSVLVVLGPAAIASA